MAGSDFAKLEAPGRAVAPKSSGFSSFVLVAGILLVVALAFSGGYWLGKEHGAQIAESAEKARLVEQIKQQQEEMAKLRQEAQQQRRDADVSTSRIGDLTFYNDLPKQSVTPAPLSGTGVAPPDEMASPAEQPAPQPNSQTTAKAAGDDLLRNIIQREMTGGAASAAYVVQVGSFRSSPETAPLLKSLAGLGVHASVRQVDLKEKGQWYRVYAGPYPSRDEADKARLQIRKNLKIDGLVLRDR
ncbi:MAG TPA: SPOR domain-containing protein [Mariprofundaceae bacterium]|nr:SPOR domain-containing protein [Mariprofundaceae bacterium]